MVFFEKHGMEGKNFFHYTPLKNYSFPLHFHRAYELIYVNSGQLNVSIDQRDFLLKEHDMVFVFSNQIHEFKTIEYSDICVMLFPPEVIGDFYINYKGLVPEDNKIHWEKEIDFQKLESVYGQKSFLYDVCSRIVEQSSFAGINKTRQSRVLYQILLYVEENYDSACTLKDIARYLQYDYPYISKLFVRQMNMTFTDYINQYRISQACYQLKNTDRSISEIAADCGYNNLRTFHRNFKEIMTCAPGEYRAMD